MANVINLETDRHVQVTDPGGTPVLSPRRFLILIAAVLMQMCLGATYSWSVYVASLRAALGLEQGPAQLPFTVFYIVFPATMLFSGTLLLRLGPRFCAVAGGALFGGGWILAALGAKHFAFTVAGVGVLGGIGVGFAYLVPVSACVQWFPRHKGLVTGIALAGFGGGAALISQVAGHLMNTRGFTAFGTFRLLGICFLVIVGLAGMTICFPPLGSGRRPEPLPFTGVVRNRLFRILYLTMFVGLIAGFTVNANMTKLYAGPDVRAGVTAVALFAIANALGRIAWGLIFDRVHSATAVALNLTMQGLLLLAGFWLLKSTIGFELFALVAGFNYGGVLVIHASCAARHWGGEHVGQVYGWLSSSTIPAALAPLAAGFAYDRWKDFQRPLLVIAVVLLTTAISLYPRLKSAPH